VNVFQLIPERFRTALYLVLGTLVLAEGATSAAYAAIEHDVPKWLLAVAAATAYVGAAAHFTAAANVSVPPTSPSSKRARRAPRTDAGIVTARVVAGMAAGAMIVASGTVLLMR
jgi:hypothetical protein